MSEENSCGIILETSDKDFSINFKAFIASLVLLFSSASFANSVALLISLIASSIIFASLVIALTYLGAEDAQLFMQIPAAVGFLFQGLVLFYLLGADFLVKYKLEFKKSK